MSQTWTDDSYAAGHVGQTDLQNMENNFLALKSSFSGGSAPSNPIAGMPWFDTAQKVLKTRDNANAAWLGLFHGSVDSKILVYDDDVLDGYARDAGVTDKVIALKGGATYVTGGAPAGSWTIGGITAANESAHTHSHTHTGPSHNHKAYDFVDSNSARDGAGSAISKTSGSAGIHIRAESGVGAPDVLGIDLITSNAGTGVTNGNAATGTAHSHTITQDGTARIAAAVVILVYLDL